MEIKKHCNSVIEDTNNLMIKLGFIKTKIITIKKEKIIIIKDIELQKVFIVLKILLPTISQIRFYGENFVLNKQ